MIRFGSEITVLPVELDENNHASVTVELGKEVDSVVLVISGTTPITRQKADYQIEIKEISEKAP
jgi:hypothetical protein